MSTKHLSKFASNISSFFLNPCGTPPSPEVSKSKDRTAETEGGMLETTAPTTRRRSSRINAAEVNTQSEPADSERTNEDTKMRDTETLPPTDTLDIVRDTVMQDTEVPSEPAQLPVIGTDLKPRQGSSVSHTFERAISALHREHEAEDEEIAFHRSDTDADNSSNGNDHDSNSGGSFNSEDMDEKASRIASVVQTKEISTVAHEEHSASESNEDELAQAADKDKRERREKEREGMDKDANPNANRDVDVNKIPATMPVPPPRSLTSTAPLPGSDLVRSLNVPDYRINISPPSPTRASSYAPPAPALSLIPTTAPPSSHEVPDVKYCTYRCAGTYQYRELVTINGIEQYGGPMIPVNCGTEFQIKLGTRRNEMGHLVNAEPLRCKVCKCRMVYKVRTNRMIQFEAR